MHVLHVLCGTRIHTYVRFLSLNTCGWYIIYSVVYSYSIYIYMYVCVCVTQYTYTHVCFLYICLVRWLVVCRLLACERACKCTMTEPHLFVVVVVFSTTWLGLVLVTYTAEQHIYKCSKTRRWCASFLLFQYCRSTAREWTIHIVGLCGVCCCCKHCNFELRFDVQGATFPPTVKIW